MSKAILISIKPQYVAKILNGEKSIEVRKNKALYKATMKLIEEQGYATFFMYCSKDKSVKTLLYRPTKSLECSHYINGKVVAKFTVRKVEHYRCMVQIAPKLVRVILKTTHLYSEQEKELLNNILENSCLSEEEFGKYLEKETTAFSGFYAYHIEDLVIFDKPKELSDFMPIKWNKCGVKDKNGLYQCDKCPYGEVLPYGSECHYKSLKRSPQNFCYVESEE